MTDAEVSLVVAARCSRLLFPPSPPLPYQDDDDEDDDDEIELASNGTKDGIRSFVGASLREGRGVPSPVMQAALQQLEPRAREALMSATA